MLRKLRGQSLLEYAMSFSIIVAALIAMKFYVIRGIQGRYYETVHGMGDHYSAGQTTYNYTTEQMTSMCTTETFGLDPSTGVQKQGVSSYQVLQPAEFRRHAVGADAEKINVQFDSENLY